MDEKELESFIEEYREKSKQQTKAYKENMKEILNNIEKIFIKTGKQELTEKNLRKYVDKMKKQVNQQKNGFGADHVLIELEKKFLK